MPKSYMLGLIVGIALLAVAGVGASRLQQKDAKRSAIEAEEKEYEEKVADATPVEFGEMSEKQRIHSQLYTEYRERPGGKTISGLVAEAKGKSKIVKTIAFVGMQELLTEPETPEKYFGNLAQASDAVIRGRAIRKVSQITKDDSFIFTDYDIMIVEILKNNKKAPLITGATVSITRPGGRVIVDDIMVEAEDRSFEPLPIDNPELLLFLRYIPDTGAYKATQATGGFELNGSTLRPLTQEHFPPGIFENKDSLLQKVRIVSHQ